MKHIKHVVFDFDGVFYSYDRLGPGTFGQICDTARNQAVQHVYNHVTDEQISGITNHGYEEYWDAAAILGGNPNILQAKQDIHCQFHHYIMRGLDDQAKQTLFADCHLNRDKLLEMKESGLKMCILSHGDKESWIDPLLEHMELDGVFDHIIDFKANKFESKAHSPIPLQSAFKLLGATPSNTLFIEDSFGNLKTAKQNFRDISTMWIAPSDKPKPAEVDIHVPHLQAGLMHFSDLVLSL